MFQSRTGWMALVLAAVGTLTTADMMPLVSELLVAAIGPEKAHLIGVALAVVGGVVAKMSDPKPPAP